MKKLISFTRESTRVSKMNKSQVTQEDIARKLKVSRITVSKALRNHPDISALMKEKVKKAADEMGYSPNLIASQLSLGRTFTLGIVVPDLENSFFAYLTDSIIDTATDRNYHIILTVSRENEEIEEQNIRNLIGMRVDGLLVCISQFTTKPDVFKYAGKVGIPLVFFDRFMKDPGFSFVTFNDKKGTDVAIQKIADAGYRKIAHFAGYQNISIGRERCNSFKSAMKRQGLQVEDRWIIEGGFETEDGYQAFEKLRTSVPLPEIILTVNDRVALGVYQAAKEAGMRIPDDIAVTGFGFIETTSMFTPPLAVINQDPRKLGVTVANLLIDEIEGKAKGQSKILIDEEFIINDSIKINFKSL